MLDFMDIITTQCTSDRQGPCAKSGKGIYKRLTTLKIFIGTHRFTSYSLWTNMKALWHFRYKFETWFGYQNRSGRVHVGEWIHSMLARLPYV